MQITVQGNLIIQVVDPSDLAAIDSKLAAISQQLGIVQSQEAATMATIQDVQAEVTSQTDVVNSVVTLLNGLKAQLHAAIASGDPTAIQAVADGIAANTQALSDAAVANTPAATPPLPTSRQRRTSEPDGTVRAWLARRFFANRPR